MELHEVLEEIDIVFRQLEFAIRLLSFAELENSCGLFPVSRRVATARLPFWH
jgi:hypothetical protein